MFLRALRALMALPEAGGAARAGHGGRRHGWVNVNIIKTRQAELGAAR